MPNSAQEAVNGLKLEAAERLREMIGDHAGIDRLIECIVLASALQLASWQQEAVRSI